MGRKDLLSVGFLALCLGALLALHQRPLDIGRHDARQSDFRVESTSQSPVWGPSSPGWGQRAASHEHQPVTFPPAAPKAANRS